MRVILASPLVCFHPLGQPLTSDELATAYRKVSQRRQARYLTVQYIRNVIFGAPENGRHFGHCQNIVGTT